MNNKKDMLDRFAKAMESNEVALPDYYISFKDMANRHDLRGEIKLPTLSDDDNPDPIDNGVVMRMARVISSVESSQESPSPELINKVLEQLEDEIYVSLKCGSKVPPVTIDELRDAINDKDNSQKMNRIMIQNNRWFNQRWQERMEVKIERDYQPSLYWGWRL